MANIDPAPSWADIRQLETADRNLAGAGGVLNTQATSIAARLKLLRDNATALNNTVTGVSGRQDSADSAIASLESQTSQNSSDISSLQEEIDPISSSITRVMKSPSVSGIYNPSGLSRWNKALSYAERVTARMYITGNSVFDGVSVDGTSAPSDASMDLYGSAGIVRAKFSRDFGANPGGVIPASDTRWTVTGTAPTTGSNNVTGPGGGKARFMSSGSSLSTTTPKATTIILHYYAGSGLGTFTYSIDGATPVSVATNVGSGYLQVKLEGLSDATHTVVIAATSNSVFFCSIEYHSGRGVMVGKYARSSWGLKDTYGTGVNSSGASSSGQVRAKQGFAMGSPDLVTLGWVRNDWKNQTGVSYSAAQYVADLEEIYGYVVAAGGCVLVIAEPDDQHSNDSIGDSYGPTRLSQFHEAAKSWAITKKHASFASIAEYWGSWENAQSFGLYRASNDEVHPGPAGQCDIGRLIYQMLNDYKSYVA